MLFNCRYSEKYFYSLREIIDSYYQDGNTPFSADDEFSLDRILEDFCGGVPSEDITGINSNEFEAYSTSPKHYGLLHKLFMYIANKHQDEYIGFGEIANPSSSELQSNSSCRRFFRLMVGRMVETYPKYSKLLKLYDDEKNNLMADIKSTTRFNDTPQLADSYADDRHATNFTEYNNQYASKMARIDEIERLYENLMGKWVDEFTKLFIEE